MLQASERVTRGIRSDPRKSTIYTKDNCQARLEAKRRRELSGGKPEKPYITKPEGREDFKKNMMGGTKFASDPVTDYN